ncbi:Lamina-associated polypeptide 2, isoform alpha [Acipenser ruthenus]|uniref:Lamina-associated polypeptide 2, isoform alpha n=1 Tax=Acipenser ruthenus TaxID=7906 RepID=A0A444U5N4_ACIRT|nr:Lamina-associated polypeptide 2, isoform alpha [Acipenser ruthenus]
MVADDVIDSAPGDDAEYAEAPAPIYTNADAVLRRILSLLNINIQTTTKEDDFLSITDARDKKAFEGLPFHEAAWKPIAAIWERSASGTVCLPRVDQFYRVPTSQKDHLFKLPKLDTILATMATSSRPAASDCADKNVDTFLKRSCTASTCGMRISNYQVYAAKYQHKLWGQLSAALQTPTPENIELAMHLAEEGKNVSKMQLQAACDAIDTNARAVASAVATRRCIQMKPSALTPDTQARILELPFQDDLLFGTGLKDSVPDGGGKTGYSVQFTRDERRTIQERFFQ